MPLRIVKRGLPARNIMSVQDMGWAGVKNGRLLKLVAVEFDIFITSDKNLRHQQNLAEIDVAIILIPSNQVPVVKALLPQINEALNSIGSHDFIEI